MSTIAAQSVRLRFEEVQWQMIENNYPCKPFISPLHTKAPNWRRFPLRKKVKSCLKYTEAHKEMYLQCYLFIVGKDNSHVMFIYLLTYVNIKHFTIFYHSRSISCVGDTFASDSYHVTLVSIDSLYCLPQWIPFVHIVQRVG